jgi:hypothetical protein
MRRRDFIALATGGLGAWPFRARAQGSAKVWRMGFLAHGHENFYDALFEGLRPLGYVEGKNLLVERRYAEGHPERFLTRRQPDDLFSSIDFLRVVLLFCALARAFSPSLGGQFPPCNPGRPKS